MMNADYQGDEGKQQEHFRKTFITENQKGESDNFDAWTLHDMMIPAGITSKLVRISDPKDEDFRISEVCDKLKLTQPTPVIILAGAMSERAGKTLAGVARAAVRAEATIIDSGIQSGIEKFCLRKKLTLMGVSPDKEIIYPRINPEGKKPTELTNGHTHFFLIGDPPEDAVPPSKDERSSLAKKRRKEFYWGEEAPVKLDLARRIAAGRPKKNGPPSCKCVMVLTGDNPSSYKEVQAALARNIPVIILEGSELSNMCMEKEEHKPIEIPEEKRKKMLKSVLEEIENRRCAVNDIIREKIYRCPDNSEDLAAIVHLLLTVTI